MPSARKRGLQEVDSGDAENHRQPTLLDRIRNMWQFANLFQFVMLFGKVVKIDDSLDIDDLESECLNPHSMALQNMGLSFLKFLSSHRGLTHELFDEYTRRQYLAKAPLKNPFGDDDAPLKFADFDIFQKIRVLHQMTVFIMMNPDRLREKADEQKDIDQTSWRIEPYGWDKDDRTYFVLDDNRIYRQTEAPAPLPKPKKNTKKARAALRASKRRRISAALASDTEDAGDEASESGRQSPPPEDDGLGGMTWECVAATLDDVRAFLSTIQKSKDANEKVLRDQIQEHLVPILEKQEESQKRKLLQREKELLNLEKMAHAKRSSRIATRVEQQKVVEHAREEERKRRGEEAAALKEEQQRRKIELERDKRLQSREKRLKEREARRQQHEEELALLSEEAKSLGEGSSRLSERRRQAEIERSKQALREIEEEDDWIFDCVCGAYGQVDDGTHSMACERCSVWQHSKCLGIKEEDAEAEDFHFVCDTCRRRETAEKEQRPRIIKLKVNRIGSSSPAQAIPEISSPPQPAVPSQLSDHRSAAPTATTLPNSVSSAGHRPGGVHDAGAPAHPNSQEILRPGAASVDTLQAATPSAGAPNVQARNPFSSPHPTLSPPGQSPNKSKAYNSIFRPSSPTRQMASATDGAAALSPLAANGHSLAAATPTANGHESPSKLTQSVEPSSAANTASAGSVAPMNSSSTPSVTASVPNFTPRHEATYNGQYDERSSPLPPSRGGISPTKNSPLLSHSNAVVIQNGTPTTHGHGTVANSPKPSILAPVPALSPSVHKQILTPPVKSAEPARVASPQQQVHNNSSGENSAP